MIQQEKERDGSLSSRRALRELDDLIRAITRYREMVRPLVTVASAC